MADPYGDIAVPAGAQADPYAAIAVPAPRMGGGAAAATEPDVPTGNVPMDLPQDQAAGYFTSRIRNALTGIGTTPRAMADVIRYGGNALGVPKNVIQGVISSNPVTFAGQFMPTADTINKQIERVAPDVSSKTEGGKVADTALESAIGGLALGGGASSVIPSLVGGATSEVGGQAFKGTAAEPVARVLGGAAGGALAAGAQNVLGSVIQGVRNVFPDINETSAKILARNLLRDKMTAEELAAEQTRLGAGTPLVEAGGPNVRGMVQGAIAAPGEARTTTQQLFDQRRADLPERVSNALDTALTPNRSLAGTVDELNALRAQKATPAYQAAGIPDRPAMVSPERTVRFSLNEEPTTIPAEYNTPSFSSPKLDALIQDSADVRAAIGAARRLPDYKDLPTNSMSMLDKAYKHLVGMEQEAVRGGNGTRVHDLQNLRRDFGAAIAEVNPRYGRALEAYAGPSKLIDAAEQGNSWMTSKADATTVAREFGAMSPAEQDAAKIGIRDWARKATEEVRKGVPSDQVFGAKGVRDRLMAVLSDSEYAALKKEMDAVSNTANTISDIRVGSRTTPMALNAADNADQTVMVDAAKNVARGRPIAATMNVLSKFAGRVAEGRTEAVNARLAEIARMTDPQQVGLVAALANKAALQDAARSAGRQNALIYGAAAPAIAGASGGRR